MKVKNMLSDNGKAIPNQFIIEALHGSVFQSYDSVIASKSHDGSVLLDINKWDYSVTTGKYRNHFLGEGIADTRKKIKSGIYKLVDLNK